MTDDRCQRYLEEPEANAAHLAECEACRALTATLEESGAQASSPLIQLDVNALPVAPWEGASHRPWGLIVSLASGVFVLAFVVCVAAGTSITKAVTSSAGTFDMLRDLVRLTGDAAPHAPVGWRVFAILLFFAVNGLLVLLLRRSPRGMDA
jgi:hypothetical protein